MITSKIVSSILMCTSLYIGISHGLRVFKSPTASYIEMMNTLGITNGIRLAFGITSIISVVLIVLPKTFFYGNLFRATILLILMCLALKAGNFKFALIEIPILAIPLVLIYLGHPLQHT